MRLGFKKSAEFPVRDREHECSGKKDRKPYQKRNWFQQDFHNHPLRKRNYPARRLGDKQVIRRPFTEPTAGSTRKSRVPTGDFAG